MEKLFKDFNPATAADWKARLEKDLKGITFEQLSVTDRNGITVRPFYTREDTAAPAQPLRSTGDWSVCASIKVQDAATANRQALEELNNGASGLCFELDTPADPAILLEGIELPYIYSHFRLQAPALPFATALQDYLAAKGSSSLQQVYVSFDFIGQYLQGRGNTGTDQEAFLAHFNTGKLCLHTGGELFQNTGATSSYELACILAQVNEYLQLPGADLQQIKTLHITVATDTAFFEQIAKLRALRLLIRLLLEQYQLDIPLHLHATTSDLYRSPFDSYSNLLRDTAAGMAAVLGGCDSLYIHPFNESKQEPDDFSRRMSRNQQLIFKDESYLDKVADVAAGSYYLESLTEQLAAKAWEAFKDMEQNGGLIAFFEKGGLQETIAAQAQQLVQAYQEGKRILIGVNKFPNPKDEPAARHQVQPQAGVLSALSLTDALLAGMS